MVRSIIATMLMTLIALLLGFGVIYAQSRSDSVLNENRRNQDAEQIQQRSAETAVDGAIVDFGSNAADSGNLPSARVERSQARDKSLILFGLSRWLLWGLLTELAFAAMFAAIALARSRTACMPEDFKGALVAWRLLGLGLWALLGLHAYLMLGARNEIELISGAARVGVGVLLFVLASAAFYLGTVFAVPTKMIPSVPGAGKLRNRKGRAQ